MTSAAPSRAEAIYMRGCRCPEAMKPYMYIWGVLHPMFESKNEKVQALEEL